MKQLLNFLMLPILFLTDDESYLAKAQTIPANTNATGNQGGVFLDTMGGAVEIVLLANNTVNVADAKTITLHLEDSADNSSFADINGATITITTSGATEYAAGEEICRVPIPSTARPYVRCNIATNDAGATGKIDVKPEYLPR